MKEIGLLIQYWGIVGRHCKIISKPDSKEVHQQRSETLGLLQTRISTIFCNK